jgi:hypothetical protein
MRGLKQFFFNELKAGSLKPLLNYIQDDNTLDLEIRANYINIYYRGGNVLRVNNDKNSRFLFHFDEKYLKKHPFIIPPTLNNFKNNQDWNSFFPLAKQAMDYYFTKDSKQEREFQQLVVRENNNSSIANGTDYFIIDIEYDNHDHARFDLIAVEWQSNTSHRKLLKGIYPKLVVIEMKYGDGSFKGSAGIHKHISDFNIFSSNLAKVNTFKNEMLDVFKQKRELGLIPCLSGIGKTNSNAVLQFADEIEMIFLIANHDPESRILKSQLSGMKNQNVKFITSNFIGYGLYKENLFDCPSFISRYLAQI